MPTISQGVHTLFMCVAFGLALVVLLLARPNVGEVGTPETCGGAEVRQGDVCKEFFFVTPRKMTFFGQDARQFDQSGFLELGASSQSPDLRWFSTDPAGNRAVGGPLIYGQSAVVVKEYRTEELAGTGDYQAPDWEAEIEQIEHNRIIYALSNILNAERSDWGVTGVSVAGDGLPLAPDSFFDELEQNDRYGAISGSSADEKYFIFVHGYNTNFSASLESAADFLSRLDSQIQGDEGELSIGTPVLFTWPTQRSGVYRAMARVTVGSAASIARRNALPAIVAGAISYDDLRKRLNRSETIAEDVGVHLAELVLDLAARHPCPTTDSCVDINILAYSMGTDVTAAALEVLERENLDGVRLNVAFAAGHVANATVGHSHQQLRQTSYTSDEDFVLWLARHFQGDEEKIGLHGSWVGGRRPFVPTTSSDWTTVDVSQFQVGDPFEFGHDYYKSASFFFKDYACFFNDRRRAIVASSNRSHFVPSINPASDDICLPEPFVRSTLDCPDAFDLFKKVSGLLNTNERDFLAACERMNIDAAQACGEEATDQSSGVDEIVQSLCGIAVPQPECETQNDVEQREVRFDNDASEISDDKKDDLKNWLSDQFDLENLDEGKLIEKIIITGYTDLKWDEYKSSQNHDDREVANQKLSNERAEHVKGLIESFLDDKTEDGEEQRHYPVIVSQGSGEDGLKGDSDDWKENEEKRRVEVQVVWSDLKFSCTAEQWDGLFGSD